MDLRLFEVPVEKLKQVMDPNDLDFETTEQVDPLLGTVGQHRAVRSIEFGLDIKTSGYNIYAAGVGGTGKNSTVKAYVERAASNEKVPWDWVYVYNFDDPYRPNAISLPPGRGQDLAKDMTEFVAGAKLEIPRAFESENYEQRKNSVVKELQTQREALSTELQQEAQREGFAIETTPIGIVVVPVAEGRPLTREEYEALAEEKKKEIQEKSERLQSDLHQALGKARKLEKETSEAVRQLDKEIALFAVGHLLDALREKYAGHPQVLEYLKRVQAEIVEHLDDFRSPEKEAATGPLADLERAQKEGMYARYEVNVLINNKDQQGAPVIVENNPTYYNLTGRIDYRARLGGATTDFTMIKAGALHRANGGFLIVQARDVLLSPFSWDTLKRSLRAKEVRIENMAEQYSPIPAATLKPDPIPLDVKVIMIGHPQIFYLLLNLDEDFQKLFKVKADFTTEMDRSLPHIQRYAAFISRQCQESNLRHFHKSGVAKIVEYGSRLIEDQKKISTRFIDISDVVAEASYWAEKDNSQYVMAEHVKKAVDEKVYRSNLIEERVHELIDDGTIMIDTEGAIPGQINGLSISSLGDYYFGRPSRITASVALGPGRVVNIERETKMSGPSHSKGFMILTGYILSKYAQDKPLSLSASLTFEQLYDGVDGDSASSTELYALLSSLSEVPLKQNIAVTGSVNQKGEVQPIGGVTKKIEGFFDVCRAKGLTGDQGVMIPQSNIKNLMLRDDVVEAIKEGKFHIYAVKTIEEGIEILTGIPAGKTKPDGTYEEGTINFLVNKRLQDFAEKAKQFDISQKGAYSSASGEPSDETPDEVGE